MTRSNRQHVASCVMILLCALLAQPLLAQSTVARPKILGISHVSFFVSDLPKALDFWQGLLGYADPYDDIKYRDGSVHIAFLKINDHQHIELFKEQPPTGEGRLSHLAFITDNAEQMHLYLAAHGVAVPNKVETDSLGDLSLKIKDPDGNLIEFVQPLPTGLEARNLGKSLPDTRISDRIFHVGFLVGDTQQSLNFYGSILGFREFWRGSSNGKALSWIDMRVPNGDDYIEFMLYSDLPAPDKRGGQNHVSLAVPDVAKSIAILEARPAYKTYAKPITSHIGVNGQRQVNLFDPDGTRVELMEPVTASGKPVPASTAPPPR